MMALLPAVVVKLVADAGAFLCLVFAVGFEVSLTIYPSWTGRADGSGSSPAVPVHDVVVGHVPCAVRGSSSRAPVRRPPPPSRWERRRVAVLVSCCSPSVFCGQVQYNTCCGRGEPAKLNNQEHGATRPAAKREAVPQTTCGTPETNAPHTLTSSTTASHRTGT